VPLHIGIAEAPLCNLQIRRFLQHPDLRPFRQPTHVQVSVRQFKQIPVFGFALGGSRSDAPHAVADDPYVAIMMTLLCTVRIVNGLNGGPMAENLFILVGSGLMLALSVTGLLLQDRIHRSPA